MNVTGQKQIGTMTTKLMGTQIQQFYISVGFKG
jgi:hypothetical protein